MLQLRRHRRTLCSILIPVLALAVPTAATAKPGWIDGQTVRSTVVACAPSTLGAPVLTAGVLAQVGFYADPRALPRVGQTFYSRIFIGGSGEPCVTQFATVELVLPLGVRPAVSKRTPIRCSSFTVRTPAVPAQGCPRALARGRYGLHVVRTNRADGMWELPRGQGYFIDVPLRSARTLRGIGSNLPACGRRAEGPPCPPAQARDYLQAAVFVADGNRNPWLVPQVGLFVRSR